MSTDEPVVARDVGGDDEPIITGPPIDLDKEDEDNQPGSTQRPQGDDDGGDDGDGRSGDESDHEEKRIISSKQLVTAPSDNKKRKREASPSPPPRKPPKEASKVSKARVDDNDDDDKNNGSGDEEGSEERSDSKTRPPPSKRPRLSSATAAAAAAPAPKRAGAISKRREAKREDESGSGDDESDDDGDRMEVEDEDRPRKATVAKKKAPPVTKRPDEQKQGKQASGRNISKKSRDLSESRSRSASPVPKKKPQQQQHQRQQSQSPPSKSKYASHRSEDAKDGNKKPMTQTKLGDYKPTSPGGSKAASPKSPRPSSSSNRSMRLTESEEEYYDKNPIVMTGVGEDEDEEEQLLIDNPGIPLWKLKLIKERHLAKEAAEERKAKDKRISDNKKKKKKAEEEMNKKKQVRQEDSEASEEEEDRSRSKSKNEKKAPASSKKEVPPSSAKKTSSPKSEESARGKMKRPSAMDRDSDSEEEEENGEDEKEPYLPVSYRTLTGTKGSYPDIKTVDIASLKAVHQLLKDSSEPVEELLRQVVRRTKENRGSDTLTMKEISRMFEDQVDVIFGVMTKHLIGAGKKRKMAQKKLISTVTTLCNRFHCKPEVAALQATQKKFVDDGARLYRDCDGYASVISPDGSFVVFGSEVANETRALPFGKLIEIVKASREPIARELRDLDADPSKWQSGLVMEAAIQTMARKAQDIKSRTIENALDFKELPSIDVSDIHVAYDHMKKYHHFDQSMEASLFFKHLLDLFNYSQDVTEGGGGKPGRKPKRHLDESEDGREEERDGDDDDGSEGRESRKNKR